MRHSNGSMIGAVEPNWTGAGWVHGSPLFTFAGIALVYTPMKLGLRVIYQPRFDAGRWLEVVEDGAAAWPSSWCRPWPTCSSTTRVRRGGSLVGQHVLGRERPAGALRGGAAAGQDARRPGVEQLRHDRSRVGLLHHAPGGGGEAPGIGRADRPARCGPIVDEHDQPLPADTVGEVRLQMPGRQREYYDDPDATAEVWRDGWLVTGDLGKLDRTATSTSSAAPRTSSSAVVTTCTPLTWSTSLVQHDAVKEVAVVGAPHPVLGEDVVAFVVLHEGAEADGDELRAFGLEQLADYKVPRQFVFIDELPRNPTGKVVKPESPGSPPARPDHVWYAPMNSAGFPVPWSERCHTYSYTEQIMTSRTRPRPVLPVPAGGQLPG